jgi:hypothetical protein
MLLRAFRVQQALAKWPINLNTVRIVPRPVTHHPLLYSFNMATITTQSAFATIDLSAYDAEQSRLMDERCIVVDEQDNVIGALDKKTCTCYCTLLRLVLPKHQQVISWRTLERDCYIARSQHLSSALPTANSCCSSVRRRKSHSLICGQIHAAHTRSTTLRKKRLRKTNSECALLRLGSSSTSSVSHLTRHRWINSNT